MSELKPCPFCGGEAHVLHVGDWWVEHACKKLGKYIGTRFCETEEEAIAWWNTRAERTCKLIADMRKDKRTAHGQKVAGIHCSVCGEPHCGSVCLMEDGSYVVYREERDVFCRHCGSMIANEVGE